MHDNLIKDIVYLLGAWERGADAEDYANEIATIYHQLLHQPEQDYGFDRTASHMAGEYVDTAQQEPVARVNRDGFIVETGFGILEGTLLYAAPPIREWVGLTDKEVDAHKDIRGTLRYFEQLLKERNT